jgi:hypothetical protein
MEVPVHIELPLGDIGAGDVGADRREILLPLGLLIVDEVGYAFGPDRLAQPLISAQIVERSTQ